MITYNCKVVLALISVVLCAAFTGCIQSNQEIVVDEGGMAIVNFNAIADKSQAGGELSQFAWVVQQLIPELNKNYEQSSYTFEEGYTEYLVYEWTAKEKVPVTDIRGVTWSENNGSYKFELRFGQVLDPAEIDKSELDDVVMKVRLVMPKTIEVANTPYVDEDAVQWVITKDLLTRNDTVLMAIAE